MQNHRDKQKLVYIYSPFFGCITYNVWTQWTLPLVLDLTQTFQFISNWAEAKSINYSLKQQSITFSIHNICLLLKKGKINMNNKHIIILSVLVL